MELLRGACPGKLFQEYPRAFVFYLRKFFPAIVTGPVVIAIGLSLLGVGINFFFFGTGKIITVHCQTFFLEWLYI